MCSGAVCSGVRVGKYSILNFEVPVRPYRAFYVKDSGETQAEKP